MQGINRFNKKLMYKIAKKSVPIGFFLIQCSLITTSYAFYTTTAPSEDRFQGGCHTVLLTDNLQHFMFDRPWGSWISLAKQGSQHRLTSIWRQSFYLVNHNLHDFFVLKQVLLTGSSLSELNLYHQGPFRMKNRLNFMYLIQWTDGAEARE